MIVRSIRTPTAPATRNAAGIATRIESPMCRGIADLDDVGRIGAEHHQLAMGHVDDAHDAKRDGQADGDQHEHRAQAQAEEQRLDRGIKRSPASRCAPARLAAAVLTVSSGSTNVPSGDFLQQARRACSARPG